MYWLIKQCWYHIYIYDFWYVSVMLNEFWLNLEDYQEVRKRRDNTEIYLAIDQSHYLKAWKKASIRFEKELYEILSMVGFNVPSVLEYKENSDSALLKESLASGTLFADVFEWDFNTNGQIEEIHFKSFIEQVKKHLNTQIQLIIDDKTLTQNVIPVLDSIPDKGDVNYNAMIQWRDYILNNLASLPLVRNHGDYNAENIFSESIIDFVDSGITFLGYDLATAISLPLWFPYENEWTYEAHKKYSFTPEQVDEYLKMLDNNKLHIQLSDPQIFGWLVLAKGYRTITRMKNWPEMKKYRYKKYLSLLNEYIQGKDILPQIKKML